MAEFVTLCCSQVSPGGVSSGMAGPVFLCWACHGEDVSGKLWSAKAGMECWGVLGRGTAEFGYVCCGEAG